MQLPLLVLAAALALTAQDRNPFRGDAGEIDKGHELYMGACSTCHGASGQGGQGPNLLSGRTARLGDRQLFSAIKNGLPGTGMPPFPLPDDQVWRIAAYVRSMTSPAIRAPLTGDPEAGRALFFGKAGCAGCHSVAGQGGHPGPDLTDIGLLRTVAQLRESLLQPNERVPRGAESVTVITATGAKIEGVAANHDNYSIQVIDKSGKLHLFAKGEWKDVSLSGVSLMPNDYGKRLSKKEVDDVLAFLSRQSTRGDSDE